MVDFLPGFLKGGLSFLLYLINTIVLCSAIFLVAFFKFVIPIPWFTRQCDRLLIGISSLWITINSLTSKFFNRIEWDVRGVSDLDPNGWYLVISNHQSWVDILVLQTVFNRRIPFLKFFLKKELIWVPFLGLAWWALDFPFMQRYSKKFLEKHPHLRGNDLKRTRRACEKFKTIPVSVMNFVEGTRFSELKHSAQGSEFKSLLKPKAGGVAFVLGAMGDCLHKVVNVTIVYPDGADSFWGFISGRVRRIVLDVEVLPVTSEMTGDFFNNSTFRDDFCTWINRLWKEKDRKILAIRDGLRDSKSTVNQG
ncbi:putative 1-acyl-sn-glycerol-3-phosphate acyltransferase [Desulforapulum autotrophicum HRM2]|uniref:1-acyl-sn-glycerol-3-phosphate acyltransferase n=1 Tax=Desulforapulum autotrophicum (strain ATCC 43914 / DSM 3382 / VKM B-1955 / HRM2) TaxID=177437 RepID=C0QLG8_DESAH|nr:acyltransferase [Desulforapulum autotrophicum]ACN16272.1 putative 1-acyl-sn-glycerol-3-phosphate acyltransferase [Desulforapulum autotrophicum HRM2]